MSENDIFISNSIYPNAEEIFGLTVKPVQAISGDCIYVIDTNALLVPYTASSESVDQIRNVYSTLINEKRLILPGQVAREFAKNRPEKIKEIFQQLNIEKSKAHKLETKKYPLLNNVQEYQDALSIEAQINDLIKKYGKKISELQGIIKGWTWDDPVSSMYSQLFTKEVVFDLQFDKKKIEEELIRRHVHKIPPGYKDGAKPDSGVGDLLIWLTILEIAKARKKDIIFVSGDEKTDWLYQSEGQSLYPRFELVIEFVRKTDSKSFHIIKLSEFLNLQGVDKKTIEEVEEIEEVQSFSRWIDEIVNAFESLGGKAKLPEIYEYIRDTTVRDLPDTWDATVRYTIQIHSSDSDTYKGGRDLFRRLGRGYWALRDYIDDDDDVGTD